ncbi:hypothetical protein V6N12_069836 [Hibiscus sabdariffa]|uniref:Retrovirus-related Pol polyprotein from transposon TNT 1-94-like beta-barrel domain-containing protein n=1 Tax=Hibiscus sabdariffa TaxID=183260 RepID=A0ABR2FF28_9ROSI
MTSKFEIESERPTDFTDNNKWNEMDDNAIADLHLALADEVLSSIEEKKTTKEIFFDDVTAAILEEENRRKNKEDKKGNMQQAEALTVMRGRSTEHGQSSSHNHGRLRLRSKKNLKCYNYEKNDHLKKDCWSLPKNSNPQGNIANTSYDGDVLCYKASTTMECRKRFTDIWLIDTGATYHMTSRREWFHNYEPILEVSVYSCNDYALEIVGVGTIKLKMYDRTIKTVRDVRHVKGLKKNLLSYGLLDNNLSKIETQKEIMKFHGALMVMKETWIVVKTRNENPCGAKEDKLQRKEENDGTVKEMSEATQIHVEKEFEQRDYFDADPEHEDPEPKKFEAPTTRQSDHVKRRSN